MGNMSNTYGLMDSYAKMGTLCWTMYGLCCMHKLYNYGLYWTLVHTCGKSFELNGFMHTHKPILWKFKDSMGTFWVHLKSSLDSYGHKMKICKTHWIVVDTKWDSLELIGLWRTQNNFFVKLIRLLWKQNETLYKLLWTQNENVLELNALTGTLKLILCTSKDSCGHAK
jgi:hypothetical protein